ADASRPVLAAIAAPKQMKPPGYEETCHGRSQPAHCRIDGHSNPSSQGRFPGYRMGRDESAGIRALGRPLRAPPGAAHEPGAISSAPAAAGARLPARSPRALPPSSRSRAPASFSREPGAILATPRGASRDRPRSTLAALLRKRWRGARAEREWKVSGDVLGAQPRVFISLHRVAA